VGEVEHVPQARGSRRRRGGVWGGERVSPSPTGEGLSQKNFWFWLSIWWVLVHSGWYFFYSSATCFTRKTGVIWCPSPYFFLIFASKRTDLVPFLAFKYENCTNLNLELHKSIYNCSFCVKLHTKKPRIDWLIDWLTFKSTSADATAGFSLSNVGKNFLCQPACLQLGDSRS